MTTQTLIFPAGTGLAASLNMKIALLSNRGTVISSSTIVTELLVGSGWYSVVYTDLPAAAYLLMGFIGSVGGFVNEEYDILLATGTYYRRGEDTFNSAELAELTAQLNVIQERTDKIRI